ncbi:MAG: hypothetical protein DI562_05605 [Stenotrophomonas acidaminiphila]|jgi:hypothetical protein|nr:MAG: hypothetical protein DI562_05605 [Stenotrophomonas acidaminiphila]
MPHSDKPALPPDFQWVEGAGKDTVCMASIPVVDVLGEGQAWLAVVVFASPEVVPQRMACRNKQAALRWASRWVHQRINLLTRAAARMHLNPASAPDRG